MAVHEAPPNVTVPLLQGSFEVRDLAGNRIALFDGVNRKLTRR